MIGTTSTKPLIDTGSFACPVCQAQQTYERRQVREWLTLYFIPVIPLGSQGEFLRCLTCRNDFSTAALFGQPETPNGPTSEDFAEALLVLVACDRGKPSGDMVNELQQVIAELRSEPASSETVAGLIEQGLESRYSAIEFASKIGDSLNETEKIKVIVLIDELVRCPADEHPNGLRLMEKIAGYLGFSPEALETLLTSLEGN